MIHDHTLCYGIPGHERCHYCARNITGKITNIDFEVFDLLAIESDTASCEHYVNKLF